MSRHWEPLPHEENLFHEIYIDETSQNDHHFLVLGGLVMPRRLSSTLESDIINARTGGLSKPASDGSLREIKWSTITNGDYTAYKNVLDAYFSFAYRHLQRSGDTFRFFCSVVSTRVKGRSYSKGTRGQVGFNREIYFHCLSIGRRERRWLFHVYPDERSTTQDIKKLGEILSRGIRKTGDRRVWPFRRVRFRRSHDFQALQISDVLIGAIAFRLNGHYYRPESNQDKKQLCDYILQKTGLTAFVQSGRPRERAFSQHVLWVRQHNS
jgi:hypothetical protein